MRVSKTALKHPLLVAVVAAVIAGLFGLYEKTKPEPAPVPTPMPTTRVCGTMDDCSMLTGLSQPGGIIVPFVADSTNGTSIAMLMCNKAKSGTKVSHARYEAGRRRFNCGGILSVLTVSNGTFSESRQPLCGKEIDVITAVDCY